MTTTRNTTDAAAQIHLLIRMPLDAPLADRVRQSDCSAVRPADISFALTLRTESHALLNDVTAAGGRADLQ